MDINEAKAVGTAAVAIGAAELGSITVATVTTSAPGILGVMGLTTTTAVALPVAGTIGAALVVGYGVKEGIKMANKK